MELRWQSAEETHRGKRRKNNEDAVLSRPEAGLWAVADGMGGHHAGDVASSAIADALNSLPLNGSLAEAVDAVEDALLMVNNQLRLHARTECLGSTIGSTVVAMVSRGRVGVVLWAGDSRLYRLRGSRLEQITRDHNPISDLLDSGAVTEADAVAADTNIITRAVGGQPELYLDVAIFDVDPRDTFLLCSDGLYRELERGELVDEMRADGLEEIAQALLERCLAGAARDNVSLVIARPEPR
ncbi:MAG: protein phosphatase 2C domain-containing protein [Gammaproteobacteria bacterium]|nr:protein phosphatase 2C domain-containing protein [Gammaproteobacteria bacterium]